MNRKFLSAVMALVFLFGMTAAASAFAVKDGVYTLQWAHGSSAGGDRLPDASMEIIEEIKKASNGRLVFEHYPASQLGGERELLERTQLGTCDFCVISTGPLLGFFPEIAVTAIPYLISEPEIGWKLYDGPFGQKLGQMCEERVGWKWLGWAENGLRTLSNNKHEVKTPADMKGLKVRTMENEVHMALMNALGASATPIPVPELYTALQQGTVDGQENGLALTYGLGFYEQLKFICDLPHIYDPYILAMSRDAWDELPEDLQAIVVEYMKKFVDLERKYNSRDVENYKVKMQEAGLKIYTPTPDEAKLFIDATKDIINLIRKQVNNDALVDLYLSEVEKARAEVSKK